jgi:hypothetical protein
MRGGAAFAQGQIRLTFDFTDVSQHIDLIAKD